MKGVKYQIYPTLLDAYQGWLSSSETYQQYWGNSEDPSKTEDEFDKEQFQSLIDKINRVPMKWEDSEAADKGTAFNEAVDCLIAGRKSEKMDLKSIRETGLITADYNKRQFIFPIALVREVADYFKGAFSQIFTEAILPTKYGPVLLYGYIDELLASSIHDIKTTGKYSAGKYRNNWQHVVYPYCLNYNGNEVIDFEYNIVLLGTGTSYTTYTEYYRFDATKDTTRLQLFIERFIEFLEVNRDLITDKKIFNLI
jgi:hypothetical protein